MATDDTLRAEHETMQRAVARSRRQFAASTDGAFARTMQQAMDDYHQMRADGVSQEDACRGIEAVLRESWPNAPTKYPSHCQECGDTGYRDMTCWDQQRCGRPRCAEGHPSAEHRYVVPCECVAGDRFRRKYTRPVENDVAAVGRAKKKPGGWRRMGA